MKSFAPWTMMRWVVAVSMAAGVLASAQSTTTPAQTSCPPVRDSAGNLVSNPNCTNSTPSAPAGDRFPYPGETSAPLPSTSQPPAPQAQTPQPSVPSAPGAPAADRFPYPGEEGKPAAPANSPLQDAGSSGQSSSSSSSSSSAPADGGKASANDPDANDPAAIPRRDRHKAPPRPRQTPSQREAEDIQVASFYYNDGNYRGSYDRARDAVSLDDEDAAAHLALGNAARKLGKLDEAETAYRRVLDLDPVPKLRKAAEHALKEMTGGD